MSTPLVVHLMTASLAPGDAIGNYILTTAKILRSWGVRVYLYADFVARELVTVARQSHFYEPTGTDILWYHYSIDAENIERARDSADFTIIDYHGITPPHLFADSNPTLQAQCQAGIDKLPTLADAVDCAVVHSDFTLGELTQLGYQNIFKIPLCIDTPRFAQGADAALAHGLSQLNYWLFVGRIVPQKGLIETVRLFAAVREKQPDLALILIGSAKFASSYRREIEAEAQQLGVANAILFAGQIDSPKQLATFFQQATYYVALSTWESFCVPVAESLYFGTPVIVNDVPPLPEVAGAGGLVVKRDDVAVSAEKIINHQPDRILAASVGKQYTDKTLAHNILNMLQQMVGSSVSGAK